MSVSSAASNIEQVTSVVMRAKILGNKLGTENYWQNFGLEKQEYQMGTDRGTYISKGNLPLQPNTYTIGKHH